MNKETLRQAYLDKGYEVDPVEKWALVSLVNGVKKYDVNVITPDKQFVTAQVIEKDDVCTPAGVIKEQEPVEPFTEKLHNYVRGLEKNGVFAVTIGDTSDADKVGVATVYLDNGSVKKFVVKERNDTFAHKELV